MGSARGKRPAQERTTPGGGEDRQAAWLPRHLAVIMDGNGRWAKRRLLPRQAGHRAGLTATRRIIEACVRQDIGVLTLFAFSSENWRRPQGEVGSLMSLFVSALESEVPELHAQGVRIRFIGARAQFSAGLQQGMQNAEGLTRTNSRLILNIAASYGGRWDLVESARNIAAQFAEGRVTLPEIDETRVGESLALGGLPDPDLFIRTGGEHRISNFLLWNLAYTELYFTDTLWPDFDADALMEALLWYRDRQRRFGRTPEQTEGGADA